jgi:hypothetical protein
VVTELGRVELHYEQGRFTTRREFRSAIDGRPRTTTIMHSRRSALEWHELAEREGAVHADFPEESANG